MRVNIAFEQYTEFGRCEIVSKVYDITEYNEEELRVYMERPVNRRSKSELKRSFEKIWIPLGGRNVCIEYSSK